MCKLISKDRVLEIVPLTCWNSCGESATLRELDIVAFAAAIETEVLERLGQDHKSASDTYFGARPQIDCNDRRIVFEKGYQAGAANALHQQWQPIDKFKLNAAFLVPDEVLEAAKLLGDYFKRKNVKQWKVLNCQNRVDLPAAPQSDKKGEE